jgi:hypothetical protein
VEEVCSRRRAGGGEKTVVVVVVVGEEEGVEFGGDKLGKQNSQPLTGQKPRFVDLTKSVRLHQRVSALVLFNEMKEAKFSKNSSSNCRLSRIAVK